MGLQDDPQREPAPTSPGLGKKAASGALWMTAQKWLMRLTGLVTIAILARLLDPQDFGVVAVASAVVPFVLLLSDLGLSTYLVQVEDPDRRTLSTGFWFSLIAAVVLGGALTAAVPAIVDLLNVPDAAPVLRVLLLSVPLVVCGSVPSALLRRHLAFKRLAMQSAIAAGAAQVVAVVLALSGAGVWALVAQTLTAAAIQTGAAWISARWLPSLQFSRERFAEMMRFGYKIVAVDILGVARNWAETAIVAVALGVTGLGYLAIAQRLVQVAQDLGGSAIIPVSTVVLAQVRSTPDRLRSAYMRASALTYLTVSPVLTFVAVAAPVVLPLLFGPQWDPAVAVTRGLAVAGVLTLGAMVDQSLFYALGRPGVWFGYAIVTEVVTVGATAVAVHSGLTAVAWAFVGVALAATIARWALVSRHVGIAAPALARQFGSVVVCAGASSAAGWLALQVTPGPLVVQCAVVGLVMVTVQILLVRLVATPVYRDALELAPIPSGVRARISRLSLLGAGPDRLPDDAPEATRV
ncbi:lipopolysaccharide biosynthesis protein [Cellulomonas sp. ICMP 17802]|uniref:lipopolysaccharide biosynthesis protein n=1 Tax=Cellulomonas sp. ICMP 17802 TaxID=3239199 RepID=UPI00351AF3C2